MNNIIKVLDKEFEILFDKETISKCVKRVADEISYDFKGQDKNVIFLCIMNGSFMFASDLLKECKLDSKISFLKVTSYIGDQSTGMVKNLIGLNEDIKGKSIIIVEDIVDSGNTIEALLNILRRHEPKEIKTATLVFKPSAYKKPIKIDYIGLESPNDFLVGYGLDYDGYGRAYPSIYKVVEN